MKKLIVTISIIASLLLGLAVAGCKKARAPQNPNVITVAPSDYNLRQDDMKNVLAMTRSLLDGKALPQAAENVAALQGREVWVSVFRPGVQGVEEMGVAQSLVDGLKDAAKRLKSNDDFKTYFEGKLDSARIKISILKKKNTVKKGTSLRRLSRRLEPGVYGPMLIDNARMSINPDTIITHGWGIDRSTDHERNMRIYGKKMAEMQLRRLMQKAGLEKDAWMGMDIYRFSVYSFVDARAGGGGKAVPLYRANHLLPKEISEEQVLKGAIAAGDHVLHLMDSETGKFGYIYYPDQDELSKDYNIVRHAGTVWGLFKLYNETGEKRFLDGGLKSFEYLEKSFKTPEDNKNLILIDYAGRAYLGSMALGALATVEMPAEFMSDERKAAQEKLGNCLLAFIDNDGRIYMTYKQLQAKRLPNEQPVYFPGEAALALINLYEKTGEEKWLDGALKIADFQIGEFKRTNKPDNWMIQVMSRLYRIKKDNRYRDMGFQMADYNVKHQYRPQRENYTYQDYHGGFDNSRPPRTTPCGSRTEAMDEAYLLAVAAEDAAAMKRYGDAVVWGAWFMLTNQFRDENTYYLRNPEYAMGGIRGGLIANDIRIDYNQHVAMALMGARAVWRDRPDMDTAALFR